MRDSVPRETVRIDREPEITRRFGIQGTPTIKFFCGGREVHETVGYRPKAALPREVDAVLANHANCLASSTAIRKG